jgi:hypothetical protein
MFLDDNVAILRAEFWIKLAAPSANRESLRRNAGLLKHIDVMPTVKVTFAGTVMWHDEDLDSGGTDSRNNFTKVVEQP